VDVTSIHSFIRVFVIADLKSQSTVVSVDAVKSRVDHAAYIVKSVYRFA